MSEPDIDVEFSTYRTLEPTFSDVDPSLMMVVDPETGHQYAVRLVDIARDREVKREQHPGG